MALFPAYSDPSSKRADGSDDKPSFLTNSSFIRFNAVEPEPLSSASSDSEDSIIELEKQDSKSDQKLKRARSPEVNKTNKSRKKEPKPCPEDDLLKGLEDLCFIDTTPMPNATNFQSKIKKTRRKKGKIISKDRYFSKFQSLDLKSETKVDEEELRAITEKFNVSLREDPTNIDIWLQYVKFQDKIIKEKMAKVEKQLAIIEKAIKENPGCTQLYNEKFSLMHSVLSVDEVALAARRATSEDGRNISAWQWQLNCILFSVSQLTTPSVIDACARALDALFRAFPLTSEPLVDLLLQLCLFLRQAGLWEQLWLVIEMSLELNLSTPDSHAFKVDTVIPEDRINKTEEEIVTCGLPVGALWLRAEHLRDCAHFLPVEDSENDPQRIVHRSDVSHLVHPVRCVPRLVAVFLTVLKVPLLPGSHCSALYVGIDKVSWATESPETLLAISVHPYISTYGEDTCLTVLREMITGPQYLSLGQMGCREFLNSIISVFEAAIRTSPSVLTENAQPPLAVWFIRWLIFVGDMASASRAKKILKEHRDCIPVYTEYALLMFSLGDASTCFKVLDTAISMTKCPLYSINKRERHYVTYLYKSYIELLIKQDAKSNRDKIIGLLSKMAGISSDLKAGEGLLDKVVTKFKYINTELLEETVDLIKSGEGVNLAEIVLGAPLGMWLACQAAALHLKAVPWEAADICRAALKRISIHVTNRSQLSLGLCVEEGLHEVLVHVIHTACPVPDNYPALKAALRDAVNAFPLNLYFLHIAASVDLITGKSWTVSPVFFGDTIYKKIFTILVHRLKMLDLSYASSDERGESARKLALLARSVVSADKCDRNPLLWRLLLQCTQALTPAEGRAAFLRAIDSCPWVKAIYYDAAKMLPEEMGHIQDLLIEKELRVHITLEELEILRQNG